MPLKKKTVQKPVEISELTIELDEHLTIKLDAVSNAKSVSPEVYVIAVLKSHFKLNEGTAKRGRPAGSRNKVDGKTVEIDAEKSDEKEL